MDQDLIAVQLDSSMPRGSLSPCNQIGTSDKTALQCFQSVTSSVLPILSNLSQKARSNNPSSAKNAVFTRTPSRGRHGVAAFVVDRRSVSLLLCERRASSSTTSYYRRRRRWREVRWRLLLLLLHSLCSPSTCCSSPSSVTTSACTLTRVENWPARSSSRRFSRIHAAACRETRRRS